MASSFRDLQKCMPIIQEQYLGPEALPQIKTFIYQQLLTLGAQNTAALDWTSLSDAVGADMLSRDESLQTAALGLLPILPLEQSVQQLTSDEQIILVLFVCATCIGCTGQGGARNFAAAVQLYWKISGTPAEDAVRTDQRGAFQCTVRHTGPLCGCL